MPKPGLRHGAGAGPAQLVREVREIGKKFETTNFIVGGAGAGGRKKKKRVFFEFFFLIFKKGDYRGKRRFSGFSSLWSRDLSKIAIFAKIREIFVNCALPVQLHLSRSPFFPAAIFFSKISQFSLIFY